MAFELSLRLPVLIAQLHDLIHEMVERAKHLDAQEAAVAVAPEDDLAIRRGYARIPAPDADVSLFTGLYASEAQRLRSHVAGLQRVIELAGTSDQTSITVSLSDLITLGLMPQTRPQL